MSDKTAEIRFKPKGDLAKAIGEYTELYNVSASYAVKQLAGKQLISEGFLKQSK